MRTSPPRGLCAALRALNAFLSSIQDIVDRYIDILVCSSSLCVVLAVWYSGYSYAEIDTY